MVHTYTVEIISISIGTGQMHNVPCHLLDFFRLTLYTLHVWLLPLAVGHTAYHRQVALRVARLTLVAHDGVHRIAVSAIAAQWPGVLHLGGRLACD